MNWVCILFLWVHKKIIFSIRSIKEILTIEGNKHQRIQSGIRDKKGYTYTYSCLLKELLKGGI